MSESSQNGKDGDGALGRTVLGGLNWQLSASVIRLVAQFGFGIILARLLLPEDFGLVGIAYVVTGFAGTMADLGLTPALIQRDEIDRGHVRVTFTITAGLAFVMALGLLLSADMVATFFNDPRVAPVLRVLAVTFVCKGLTSTSNSLLLRDLRFRRNVEIQLIGSLLGYSGVAIALAYLGYGYWALVWGSVAQAVLLAVLTFISSPHSILPSFAYEKIKDLASFSSGISLMTTANYFARQGDYFVVGRMLPAESLGFYTRGYSLMEMPMQLVGVPLSRILFPSVSKLQNQPERFKRAYVQSFIFSMAATIPMSLAVALLSEEIVLVLYGVKWLPSAPLLGVLALFGAFRMSFKTLNSFIRAAGWAYRLFFVQALYGLSVVGGSILAIQIGGLQMVPWAVGASISLTWCLGCLLANQASGVTFSEFLSMAYQSSALAIAGSIALWGVVSVSRAAGAPALLTLAVGVLLCGILTAVVLISQLKKAKHPLADQILSKVPFLTR